MSTRTFQNIVFKDCGSKLSPARMTAFENKIDFALPEDFRRFLCEVNGGISEKQGFKCAGDPSLKPGKDDEEKWISGKNSSDDVFLRKKISPRMVKRFLALDAPKEDCIVKRCGKIKLSDLPNARSLIPFGTTNCFHGDRIAGDDLAISISKTHFGSIYCHDFGSPNKPKSLVELKNEFVAKSFSEFLLTLVGWNDGMIFRP